ncbi:MAG: hypothetical protein ACI8PB_004605 [Desulforhopalus sp.]|jgi:hypothetical protein
MNEKQEAQATLARRDWQTTVATWKQFSNEMNLSLIRVRSCDKIPNEGKRWQQIEYRSYDDIGFVSTDNAGIITGKKSGIIVLDVDDQEAFTQACQQNNRSVPETFTVKTGKGFHYYYNHPQDGNDYRNRSDKAEGYDIRADGGFIVAPQSVHPTSGSLYTVVDDRGFTEAPKWLLDKSIGNGEYTKVDRKSKIIRRKGQAHTHYDLPDVDLHKLSISELTQRLIVKGAEDGERSCE